MKETSVGTPVTIGEITIIPLEEVSVHYDRNKGGLLFYVSKRPIAVVVGSPQGKWAIDIYGDQVPLETYIQKIHGLQQVLDSL